MTKKILVKLETAGQPDKGLVPVYSGHVTTRGRRSVVLISEHKIITTTEADRLTAQLAVVSMDYMGLHKVSKLGAIDDKLTETDIRNILRDVQKRTKKTLKEIPKEAEDMLNRITKLEGALHEMLELSWELAVETKHDDKADDRQLRAIELLESGGKVCQTS
jgi:hypothetical protein